MYLTRTSQISCIPSFCAGGVLTALHLCCLHSCCGSGFPELCCFFFFLNTFSVSNRWFCFLTDGVTVAIRSCTLKNLIRIGKASGLTSVSRNLLLTGAAGASQAEFSVGNVDQPGM